MSAPRVVRIFAPMFGLSPDRALLLALRRLEASGDVPAWPLYCLNIPDTDLTAPAFTRRAALRNVYRKDR